jgi:pyrroloquinoline quinone biosynthesis protein E
MNNDDRLALPRDCYITLTHKCNMRCLHCFGDYGYVTGKNIELTGEQWGAVIKDLSDNGIFFVNISGGEPTTHPDFLDILESLGQNNMLFMLTTNGLISQIVVEKLLKLRRLVLGVKISLDGCDAGSYSYLRRDKRGKKNVSFFSRIMKNIKTLIDNNFPISIATCLHPQNINRLEELAELIIRIKPRAWFLSTITLSGRSMINKKIFVSESSVPKETWLAIKERCLNENIAVEFADMPTLVKSSTNRAIYFSCPAARYFCEINADGQVSPCPLARVHINTEQAKSVNVTSGGIRPAWDSDYFKWFLNMQKIGCEGCIAHDSCDRCVPQSIEWFNDPKLPPPYCVADGENLHLNNLDELQTVLREKMRKNNRLNYLEVKPDGAIN